MGRPPSSGYCHTCRRRRVKCDKLRPVCERCLSSGHKCLGYELPLRMQHFSAGTEASGAPQLIRISNTTKTTPLPPVMTQEMPLTAFREQMAFSHLIANYRWGPFWKPLLRTSLTGPTQPDAVKADYMGSLATALGFMGSRVQEPKMLAEGYELNGRVIRALQFALSAESKKALAQWAFTIIILSIYQYAVEQENNIPHYYGMAQIIEWCGPECFQQEPMLTNLRQIRAIHACKCFNQDEGSFFEQKRWKTIPWLYQPKTSYDELMDSFVDIPGLTFSIAFSTEPLSSEKRIAADARVLEMISDLHNWRRSWEMSNQHVVSEVLMPLKEDDISISWVRSLLSHPLATNTAEQAAELLIYNSALIQLMNLRDFLQTGNRLPRPFPNDIDLAVLKKPDQPLYTPEDLKYRWQPSVEGLRLMRLAPKLFASSESSVLLSASPFGIIYNSLLGTEGLGRFFLSGMTTPNDYALTDTELSIFRLWRRLTDLTR
ncbi:C6 finger domain-containing protein [Colletotrichum tofieldiae]|uniref:C6 finger domain-containing protein n=1 Tax=Colletotrichum tofieldiae TaxID=708197 RepID=A0A166PY69_9PEZI|nr:C6 finger domain-containing protein [Colletotrichum tofieldiae]